MVRNGSKSLIDWHLLEWEQSLWASKGGEAGFGSDSLNFEAWIWEEVDFWRWPMNPCALSCQQAWSGRKGVEKEKEEQRRGWWTFISEDKWTSGHKWVEAGIAASRLLSRLVHCSGSYTNEHDAVWYVSKLFLNVCSLCPIWNQRGILFFWRLALQV